MDGGEEVASSFVIAGGDTAEELEFGEEVFDQMARLVEFLVIFALEFAVGFGGNHRYLARLPQGNQDPLIGVEAFIGEQNVGLQLRQQNIGPLQIAGLTAGQMKSDGIAQGIEGGVDFGAQPAFAVSDRLLGAPFLSAPALC